MRRALMAATLAATVIAALLPAIVTAAPVMTFGNGYSGLMLRSHCISGNGPANASVHVVWKRTDGTIKAIVDVTSDQSGGWGYCSAARRLGVGDTIRASAETFARTFTMPNITLNSNRVNGSFRGIGLPGATGELWYHAGIFADYFEGEPVTADSQGRWSFPEGANGGIEASVNWFTPQGDFLIAQTVVPYVGVTIGRSALEGGSQALSDVSVRLRDASTNALLGTGNATTDDYGFFTSTFEDSSGDPRSVHVGDRVVSSIASNLDWHVPAISGTADTVNDLVNGNCGSTEIDPMFVMVRVFRTGVARGIAIVDVDSNGDFEADFNGRPFPYYNPANIKHGDRIVLRCYYDTYDVVSFPFQVP